MVRFFTASRVLFPIQSPSYELRAFNGPLGTQYYAIKLPPYRAHFSSCGFFIWTFNRRMGSWIGILAINGNGQSEANKGFDRSPLTDTQTHSLPYLIASLHFFRFVRHNGRGREAGRALILKRRIKIAPVTPLQKFLSLSFFYQWKRERKREREMEREEKSCILISGEGRDEDEA